MTFSSYHVPSLRLLQAKKLQRYRGGKCHCRLHLSTQQVGLVGRITVFLTITVYKIMIIITRFYGL